MRKLLLILIASMLWQTTFAQTPTLQQKLYYTCKVWGFVKYYHSGVSICMVNWDSVLLRTLPLVESAITSSQFNDALDTMLLAAGPMALSTTYFPDTLSPALKRNRDWGWIDSSSFRTDVQTILDTIRNNFRPHAECWVELNPYTTSNNGYLIFPYDSLELNVNTTGAYPDEDHRILMFFKYWNIIQYFNPYNYVIDKPWDTTLYNYAVPITTVYNSDSLYVLYMRIATTLDDAHAHAWTFSDYYQTLPGFYQPYLRLEYIDSQYVVLRSLVPGIYPGDAIISIDGFSTAQWEDSLRQYYSSGSMSCFRETMCIKMLGRIVNSTHESAVIQDSTGTNHTITMTCVSPNSFYTNFIYPADSLDSVSWTTLPCDIGYVNMGMLQYGDEGTMYNDLQNKSAIIFDLRNYPNGTAWNIANLMYPNQIEYAKFTMPDISYPGTCYWEYEYEGNNGNPIPYSGKVIILMNEVTSSQAEYSCMILGAMPGAVKVGSHTDGADGTVTYWRLSQDLNAGFSSLGVFYPNGDSTQRIGIVPDSVVYPTKAGIRHHDDEVLDKALEIAGCNLYVKNTRLSSPFVQVFPNPANDIVTIKASNLTVQKATINISDITGRTLLQKTVEQVNQKLLVSFDIKSLVAGMYFVTVSASGQQYVRKIVKE